jgi:putative peptidoglycan lipid II flippase
LTSLIKKISHLFKGIAHFFSTSESTASASLFISIGAMCSKLMGFVREMIIANYFGASSATDAYLVAYMFPGIIFSLLGVALGTSFLPVFTELNTSGRKKEAWATASNVLLLLGFILIIITIIGEITAPVIIPLFAPGFDGETLELSILLSRIVFPSLLFSVMNSLFSSILHSYHMFRLTSLNGIYLNVGYIVCILLFSRYLGIKALAIGVLIGFILQCIYLIPSVLKLGKFSLNSMSWKDPYFKRILWNMMPVVLSLSVHQIHIVVDRLMASWLTAGSVSSLNYAYKLISLPNQVFVTALATALFPTLSQLAAKKDSGQFRHVCMRSLRLAAVLIVPISIGMLILRVPTVGLVFERGAFDAVATQQTAIALAWYVIGLLGLSFTTLLTKAFYALQDTKTPVKIALITIPLNIALNLILVGPMGHGGLALGTSIAVLLQAVFLFFRLEKRLKPEDSASKTKFTLKVAIAGTIMGVAVWVAYYFLTGQFSSGNSLNYAIRLFVPTLLGVGTYLLLCRKFQIRELDEMIGRFTGLAKKKLRIGTGRNSE